MERAYGFFQRSISLPTEADTEQCDATFKNGILQITLPKVHPKKSARKITVKAG
jgi:HSP20 family protein